MNWKRWIWVTLVLGGVVFAVMWGFRPQPKLVELAEAKRGPLRVAIEEEGRTRVTDRFVVSPPVGGYSRRLPLRVGDAVKQGQVLVQIEPLRAEALDPRTRAQAEARVAAAEAALRAAEERVAAARANASYWEGERARVESLHRTGDLAKRQVDHAVNEDQRARAALREAQQQTEAARAEVKAARAALQHTGSVKEESAEMIPVRAPVDGRILRIFRESEGVVTAGQPLVEIGNARFLEVEVELLSADAVRVEQGTRTILTRWGGDHPLDGVVRRIEPLGITKVSALGVEEQRVPVIVGITSPHALWSRLGAGYRVDAQFILWEESDVLQIPSSALFRYQDAWAVFLVTDGVARRTAVEIGRRNGLSAQVLSGLAEGDRVVAHPDSEIEDGTLIAASGSGQNSPVQ
ncbi:MAG: efflux RND transporter periplasmic adaptor subunit [Bryobacteraceae bacterium]